MQALSNQSSRLRPHLATGLAVGFIAFLVIVLAGCGSSDSSTTSGSTSSGGSAATSSSPKIDISNFEFVPKSVTV